MKGWITVHSLGQGRELHIRADQIDLVVEKRELEPGANNTIKWVLPGGATERRAGWTATEIVLRSGEKGLCKEKAEEVMSMIRAEG